MKQNKTKKQNQKFSGFCYSGHTSNTCFVISLGGVFSFSVFQFHRNLSKYLQIEQIYECQNFSTNQN